MMECEGWIRQWELEEQPLVKNDSEDFEDIGKSNNEFSLYWVINVSEWVGDSLKMVTVWYWWEQLIIEMCYQC